MKLLPKNPTTRKVVLAAVFTALGLVIAFPLFSLSYYSMVRTSTPGFCGSCHEIEFAYNTWKTSTHANNSHGFVADCMDCHLPPPHDTVNFFFSKTAHGIKDIVLHFLKSEYDREEARERVYATMKNDSCLKCHRNLMYIPEKRGAMLAHRSVLYPMPGYEKRCLDCHRNLVHNKRSLYRYKQYVNDYRGTPM
ncbi:MAG: NapC/NirT family cytochrome c [Deltaproteobacteria bacterium]|nr:NapC/NirT family cytochrome c [Deltaproteobacteria bacterium]